MKPINLETHPDHYRHWKLSFDGPVATLAMDVSENEPASGGDYQLKLNSYDIGVDIELADAIQRIRFEHPEIHSVIVTSLKDRIFCAGANIFMLASSSHGFKVNFCKFTNETRLSIEDASAHSGLKFLCAVNGPCAGGGYELALACDEIFLVDDGSSTVALPEAPLLGVLPGTGGLTRVVDKRKVRRDLADIFSTLVEGVRGRRAVEWRLVDEVVPRSKFGDTVQTRALELGKGSDRPDSGPGIFLDPLEAKFEDDVLSFKYVDVKIDRAGRRGTLTVSGPETDVPTTIDEIQKQGCDFWALRAFRELDRAIVHLRLNEPEIGTLVLETRGQPERVLKCDEVLLAHQDHWLVREIIHFMKRTLKRLDNTARSLIALIEPESCFVGSFFEIALAADRSYMLDDVDRPNTIQLSKMSAGLLPMSNGLTRLQTRFLGEPDKVDQALAHDGPFDALAALEAGLVTMAPDDIDWEDEVRIALEERASFSPDAMTAMEANLRFAGPETMETKIFGRLTAWQNWIFQRPNAVGEKGALQAYGQAGARPEYDWRRT